MTSKGNRFGIGPVDVSADFAVWRNRDPGPMGVAVRESAASAQESSEALVEQRRLNAADAKEYRAAREQGRVLVTLPIDRIGTEALPRDRLDLSGAAASDEMDELKASIRERGVAERELIGTAPANRAAVRPIPLSPPTPFLLPSGWRPCATWPIPSNWMMPDLPCLDCDRGSRCCDAGRRANVPCRG